MAVSRFLMRNGWSQFLFQFVSFFPQEDLKSLWKVYRFHLGNLNKNFKTTLIDSGVKTERVFPGLSVVRKNNKMEVLYPEK